MQISCIFPLPLRWLHCVLQLYPSSVAVFLPRVLPGPCWQTLRLMFIPQPPPNPPPPPLSLCLSDILFPWLSCQAMLEGQWRGEANQQRPPLPPFLSSCQTPDKAFSPSFPALNGLILSGNLGPSQTSSQAGVSSDLRSSPIPLPPAGSAPSEQPNGTDDGLQSWFLSGMRRGWACLGRGGRGLVPVVSYQDFLEDPPLAPL